MSALKLQAIVTYVNNLERYQRALFLEHLNLERARALSIEAEYYLGHKEETVAVQEIDVTMSIYSFWTSILDIAETVSGYGWNEGIFEGLGVSELVVLDALLHDQPQWDSNVTMTITADSQSFFAQRTLKGFPVPTEFTPVDSFATLYPTTPIITDKRILFGNALFETLDPEEYQTALTQYGIELNAILTASITLSYSLANSIQTILEELPTLTDAVLTRDTSALIRFFECHIKTSPDEINYTSVSIALTPNAYYDYYHPFDTIQSLLKLYSDYVILNSNRPNFPRKCPV